MTRFRDRVVLVTGAASGIGRASAERIAAEGGPGALELYRKVLRASSAFPIMFPPVEIDGHLVVPFIPLKWWYPYLPRHFFIPFMVLAN